MASAGLPVFATGLHYSQARWAEYLLAGVEWEEVAREGLPLSGGEVVPDGLVLGVNPAAEVLCCLLAQSPSHRHVHLAKRSTRAKVRLEPQARQENTTPAPQLDHGLVTAG